MTLAAATDADAAAWAAAALRDFDGTVGSIVPPVFEAYARIFHPASIGRGDGELVRWAQVARANGRTMHRAAEWGSITGSWQCQDQAGVWDRAPATGDLPSDVARRLATALAPHTMDADDCWFGVWQGWGHSSTIFTLATKDVPEAALRQARLAYERQAAAWRKLLNDAASSSPAGREMHLLRGPLAAIEQFYERNQGLPLSHPPNLWWPADRRWCVATDIDLMSTYVGGSHEAIEALLENDRLEALAVSDSQGVTWDADKINPLPEPPLPPASP